jgi:GT2 family glycosyltransferase
MYFPEAEIIHYAGRTVGPKDTPYYFCHRTQSAYYFFKKNYNAGTVLKVKFFLLLGLLVKFPEIIYLQIFKENKENLLNLYLNTFKKILL